MTLTDRPSNPGNARSRTRSILRLLAAVFFMGAGANHFRSIEFYQRIILPNFPSPDMLVIISGIAEIAGGIGLLIPSLRRWAGRGLIALLIAVFPANVYMALEPQKFADMHLPAWTFWARLPLQVVIIVWVWFAALTPS